MLRPMKTEEWRKIPGLAPRYEVSDEGRIRTLAYVHTFTLSSGEQKSQNKRAKILAPCSVGKNYLCFWPRDEKGRATFYIHRAVALAFIPNPDQKPQVNHKNGVTTDNRLNNLEWSTRAENISHSFRELGRESNLVTTLSRAQVDEIIALCGSGHRKRGTMTQEEIAKRYGVHKNHIGRIKRGERRTR